MDRKKLHIPFPDEHTMHNQIDQIVSVGVKRNESFFTFVKSMYQQVGMRHLFSDRSEFMFVLFIAITMLSIYFISPEPIHTQADDLYAFVFLISPVLFIIFSIHTYTNKIKNATYEVEMACKFHVYQIIAFRMLIFSIMAMLVNSIMIFLIVTAYDDVQYFRAFMISITGLFIFSILFLYILMKRRSTATVMMTIIGWVAGNLLIRLMDNALYNNILMNVPLVVYGLVLIGCISCYMHLLKKMIHLKETEGVF